VTIQLPVASDGRSAYDIAEKAVRAAAAEIMDKLPQMTRPRSQQTVNVTQKDTWNNLVTDVDHAAERALLGVLNTAFPEDAVLAEESGSHNGTSGYTWCVDPLDGTRNFTAGIPHIAVNLALSHGDDLVMGLTFDPVREELFHATLGGGAWLNDERIVVSEEMELRQCIFGFDMGYVDDGGTLLLQMLEHLWPGMQSIRMMGSAALGLAYAAAGRYGIYAHHYVQPWDIAPGILLAREAGGTVTDLRGDPCVPASGCVIAASPEVHKAFLKATDGLPWRLSQG
jgi:myo-inositol-1(or 4)-monophosphatase